MTSKHRRPPIEPAQKGTEIGSGKTPRSKPNLIDCAAKIFAVNGIGGSRRADVAKEANRLDADHLCLF